MPEMTRRLPHFYLTRNGKAEAYASPSTPRDKPPPPRDRTSHGEFLRAALDDALAEAARQRSLEQASLAQENRGVYLDFVIAQGSEAAAESLGDRRAGIELVSARRTSETEPLLATVFVPDSAARRLPDKIEAYRTEDTPTGQPRYQRLFARIEAIALATFRSVYTGEANDLPRDGGRIWWEVWTRQGQAASIEELAQHLNVPLQAQALTFPDREVRLIYCDIPEMARLFLNSGSIAELRRAKDTPALFLKWPNVEQAEWAKDVAGRIAQPPDSDIAVCLLDTGVTRAHPLLAPVIDPSDVHAYEPLWPAGDSNGHGTNMAGTAAYGDLMPLLASSKPVVLTHCVESVKILPDQGENEPKLYGAITKESVARVEVGAPHRRRAVCMAVTSDIGTNRGRPSSWSAAVDQLCSGDGAVPRLMFISAGNIRSELSAGEYPDRNLVEPIENPAQAWNAVTVGAFTEKTEITDQSLSGWGPLAPAGGLSPTSRTGVAWERAWPLKPEILMEGGNLASLGDECDFADDLGVLTTHRDPTVRHFDVFGETSAATAAAGHLAGRILRAMPERWPETVRGLLVHSAEWTPVMREELAEAGTEQQRRVFLRTYGYGVPSYERAVLSAENDLTLIVEDSLQPFRKEGSNINLHEMNLHRMPWPRAELEQMGEQEVDLRVTLSYYVEPNPGERGWLRKHQYRSHGLRFALKRRLESVAEFRARINAAARTEEGGIQGTDSGKDNWRLGPRVRNAGSVHSDYWRGMAVDLAQQSAMAVYPVGGWWKENPGHRRYGRRARYALLVSLRAAGSSIDIYTPVKNQIAISIDASSA